MAFPVSITLDEKNNLYIADFGNNRIRMVRSGEDGIRTVAGTGEMGFSGDGDNALKARLRQPEGIAVRPGQPADARQVYFSDFKNQRIRRLKLTNGEWIIDTVAGIGAMGDAGAHCDQGCNAKTQAMFKNPRAVAFSSNQDLYIVDSGNRKIRKLTPDGTFSTFVGYNSAQPLNEDVDPNVGILLPGHFKQANNFLSLGTIATRPQAGMAAGTPRLPPSTRSRRLRAITIVWSVRS